MMRRPPISTLTDTLFPYPRQWLHMLYLRTADRALYADLSAALAMARYLERRGCRQRRRHHRVATGDGVDRADLIRANAAHPGRAPVPRRMPAHARLPKQEARPHGQTDGERVGTERG